MARLILAAALLVSGACFEHTSAKVLNIDEFHLSFEEDFHDLNVSAYGPGTKWIAHTPWGGDFGAAQFADPAPGFPFSRADGKFRIELHRTAEGRWYSGLLATKDRDGHGFAQQYGYFEMQGRLPAGPGTWPAFWLSSVASSNPAEPGVEIDVIEQYGQFPGKYVSTITVWAKTDPSKSRSMMHTIDVEPGTMSASSHQYGVDVEPDWTTFYFDRVEMWRAPTPPELRYPLMILVDLGLGGGWAIDSTPNPSFMYIDYIRAYLPAPRMPR